MMFPDMPWMLSIDSRPAEIRETATAAFGDSPAKRGRLFAFGYDAFRIADSLKRGAGIDPQGLTGTLSIDAQGRIRRELQWVRIKSGLPSSLEPQDAITSAAAPGQ
jgi:hypothetical protein